MFSKTGSGNATLEMAREVLGEGLEAGLDLEAAQLCMVSAFWANWGQQRNDKSSFVERKGAEQDNEEMLA